MSFLSKLFGRIGKATATELNRMAELLASRDSASLPTLQSFLEGALEELRGTSYKGLFSLEGRYSGSRLFMTVGGISQFIAKTMELLDSKGTPSFCVVATPHSGVSSRMKEFLPKEGVGEGELACIMPDTDDEEEKQIMASVRSGKHRLLLADAYRLGCKWHLRGLGGVVERTAQAVFLFLVDPECMTTLQIEQALETIDTSQADKFSKDVIVLLSTENAREVESLRALKAPEEPWTLDMIMDNLYKAVHENDCNELARQVQLLPHQYDPSAVWGLIESAIRLITPIYQRM